MKVILLDDVSLHREEARVALEDILRAEHPTFSDFSSPSKALDHFKREGADLIISDIVMPEMTGFEYAREVLKDKIVPIIMHTGSWSETWIKQFVLNGSAQVLPIEIAGKSFMFPSSEEYKQNLEQVYQRLMKKMPSLDHIDLTRIDQINQRTKGLKDSLIDYIKVVYQELWDRWRAEEESIPLEIRTRVTKPDFQFESTMDFMHRLRYTIGSFRELRDVPLSKNQNYLIAKMTEINDLVRGHLGRYLVTPEQERIYGKELKRRDKTHFPITNKTPIKLVNRELMQEGEEFLHLVVAPIDPEDQQLAERAMKMLEETQSKKGIVRSASLAEDGRMPCAGFFDSITYSNPDELLSAVKAVRVMQGKELSKFCEHRRLELPPKESMYLLVEPFLDRTYVGSLLEQPNAERTFWIEFQERSSPKEKKYFLCYDASKGKVISASLPENISPNRLGDSLVSLYDQASRRVVVPPEETSQLEFTFDVDGDKIIRNGLQLRRFIDRVQAQDFRVYNPLDNVGVVGSTSTEGVRLVLANTPLPLELMAMEERARKDGYGLAYIAEPKGNPNLVTYLDQLGLLITGEGPLVQSHNYYNALMKADHVLMLSSEQMENLRERFRSGTVIEYRCNGKEASLGVVDQTHEVKLQIRDALNN